MTDTARIPVISETDVTGTVCFYPLTADETCPEGYVTAWDQDHDRLFVRADALGTVYPASQLRIRHDADPDRTTLVTLDAGNPAAGPEPMTLDEARRWAAGDRKPDDADTAQAVQDLTALNDPPGSIVIGRAAVHEDEKCPEGYIPARAVTDGTLLFMLPEAIPPAIRAIAPFSSVSTVIHYDATGDGQEMIEHRGHEFYKLKPVNIDPAPAGRTYLVDGGRLLNPGDLVLELELAGLATSTPEGGITVQRETLEKIAGNLAAAREEVARLSAAGAAAIAALHAVRGEADPERSAFAKIEGAAQRTTVEDLTVALFEEVVDVLAMVRNERDTAAAALAAYSPGDPLPPGEWWKDPRALDMVESLARARRINDERDRNQDSDNRP